MKKTDLFALKAILLVVGLVATFLLVSNTVTKPEYLTESEISNYTEIAKQVWYNGVSETESDGTVDILPSFEEKTVQVIPKNMKKQILIVDFSSPTEAITIESPESCSLLVTIVYTLFFYTTISVFVTIVNNQITYYKLKRKGKLEKV